MSDVSRRKFLAIAGTTAASVWLTAEAHELFAAGRYAASAQAGSFQQLSAADAVDIEAAVAQIIPSDETPGAREARVIYFIDHALGTFAKDGQKDFQKGALELRTRAAKVQRGAKSFAALTDAQQIAVIASLEKDKHPFFGDLRGATIAGMLANPEYGGNYGKLGWKWLGFDDRFSWAAPFGWYDTNA